MAEKYKLLLAVLVLIVSLYLADSYQLHLPLECKVWGV